MCVLCRKMLESALEKTNEIQNALSIVSYTIYIYLIQAFKELIGMYDEIAVT